jgi:hypothetical protein
LRNIGNLISGRCPRRGRFVAADLETLVALPMSKPLEVLMKMPVRRYFPMDLPPDMFGLHSLTLLGEACLTDAERRERVTKIEARVTETFEAAVRQLGEDEARKLFRRASCKRKRGAAKVLAAPAPLAACSHRC